MEGNILTNHSVLSLALSNSGLILFGALLILFGIAIGLMFIIRSDSRFYKVLTLNYFVILFLFIGIIVLDLAGASGSFYTFSETRELSEILSTHRWLMIQLPVVLTFVSIVILLTYRDRISDSHARQYRQVVQVSTCVSFLSVLLIALESMI